MFSSPMNVAFISSFFLYNTWASAWESIKPAVVNRSKHVKVNSLPIELAKNCGYLEYQALRRMPVPHAMKMPLPSG